MLNWLDAIPNLGVPNVPGVQSQKTVVPFVPTGVPINVSRCSKTQVGTPGTPELTLRNTCKPMKLLEEHGEHWEHCKTDDATIKAGDWLNELAHLDPCRPAKGFASRRWQDLYDDAVWIVENHGTFAARHGWSVADLFGLWPDKPYWGGIADRLRGSRSLVMDGDRASWRLFGVPERYARGTYPSLMPFWKGLQ